MKLSERCMEVAMRHLPKGYTYEFRKGLSGYCCRKRKHIVAPKPVTRKALFVWLHECNHQHAYSQLPSYEVEYLCETFAIETMEKEGIKVHPDSVADAKRYVNKRLKQGLRSGLAKEKVKPEIAAWCGFTLAEAANESSGR